MTWRPKLPPSWPVLLLALPAFVAIWSGWVGLGSLTGFGVVRPLPGIWDSLSLNTAITLPIGVETYAAYAMQVWLAGHASAQAVGFARASALGALALGAAGQVAYHLMAAAKVSRAPWPVTALVAVLPVVVLGMGAALAHLARAAEVADEVEELRDQLAAVLEQRRADGERARVEREELAGQLADAGRAAAERQAKIMDLERQLAERPASAAPESPTRARPRTSGAGKRSVVDAQHRPAALQLVRELLATQPSAGRDVVRPALQAAGFSCSTDVYGALVEEARRPRALFG